MKALHLVILTALVGACAQVKPKPDFDRARELVHASTGQSAVFDPYDEGLPPEQRDELLENGLTLEEALRIALVTNHELRAEFQEIGIAHADWVQSQLMSNPSLDVLVRFPRDGGRYFLEAALGFALLDLWRVPVQSEAARHELEATVLRIARNAGERLADTRNAYLEAVAAEELVQVADANLALAQRFVAAVRARREAGAADALDESTARGPELVADLDLRTARIDAAKAKRELAKLLSLEHSVDQLQLSDALPTTGQPPLDAEALVAAALSSRLDLRAIDTTVEAMDARLTLEERKAWGELSVGPSFERPAVFGSSTVGGTVSLALPIFDQNQAQVARAGFELQRVMQLRESARVAVAQDVRSATQRVNTASENLSFYREELLPQAELSLSLAEESYTSGQTTLAELVEFQRGLVTARRSHVVLCLEAAISASELERVVGAPLRPQD